MHKYQVTIRMPDGSLGRCWGLFSSDWNAIDTVMASFPDAKRISARRMA